MSLCPFIFALCTCHLWLSTTFKRSFRELRNLKMMPIDLKTEKWLLDVPRWKSAGWSQIYKIFIYRLSVHAYWITNPFLSIPRHLIGWPNFRPAGPQNETSWFKGRGSHGSHTGFSTRRVRPPDFKAWTTMGDSCRRQPFLESRSSTYNFSKYDYNSILLMSEHLSWNSWELPWAHLMIHLNHLLHSHQIWGFALNT